MRQCTYCKAHEMLKEALKHKSGGCENILDRWHDDDKYRKSLSDIGWAEEQIIQSHWKIISKLLHGKKEVGTRVVSSGPNSGSMLPSLSSILVSPMATAPGVGAGLAPSSPKALITSRTWRGSASTRSSRELHRTVLLRIWSRLSR